MRSLSLQKTLFILFLAVSLIPLAIISYISYDNFSSALEENSMTLLNKDILSKAGAIENFLRNAESDILFLSESPSLKALINSRNPENLQNAKEDLQQEFLAFSMNKRIYYQVRYLDENGQEIVRIDSDGIDSKIIPEESLQNKKGRYYFDDSMQISNRQVFVSPLDLNIEQGSLENREVEDGPVYVPVIRYGTPVFDNSNNEKGIVLTNIYGELLLRDVQDSRDSSITTFLLNKDGFYLSHHNKSKEWGFMLKNNENIRNDFPEFASRILTNKPGAILEKNSMVFFSPIFPSKSEIVSSIGSSEAYAPSQSVVQGKDYFWVIASIIPKDRVLASAIKLRNEVLFLVIITMVLAILASNFLSKKITENLSYRDDLLNSLLKTFKGKFGKIAVILMRKNIQELVRKNPRIIKIVPKDLARSITKEDAARFKEK